MMQMKWTWFLMPLALSIAACDLLKQKSGGDEDDEKSENEDDDSDKKKKKKGGDEDDDSDKPKAKAKPDCDGKSAVEAHAKALLTAVGVKDMDTVQDKLLSMAMTEDDANSLFGAMYGAELGPKVAKGYQDEVFAELPKLIRPFKKANEEGQTEVKVLCIDSADSDDATGAQKGAFKAMKAKTALYTVKFVKPGESSGSSLWSFMSAGDGVRFVGEMKQASE